MSSLPRVAIGTIQRGADHRPMLWALLEVLRRGGLQSQTFFYRSRFARYRESATVTGLNPRHLDSWLMSEPLCRDLFVNGAELADLAVVEGHYAAARECGGGGDLETLCQWLGLPRLVILDASLLEPGCRIPARPSEVAGVFLDRVGDGEHLACLTTEIEALWKVPVLGILPRLDTHRDRIAAMPAGERLCREICQELGSRLERYWNREAFLRIARSAGSIEASGGLLDSVSGQFKLNVAVAYDDAFNCYFTDALDLLEARGATVVDFSPLREESLPPDTDIAYFGCGHPERYADELSDNHCMKTALRDHLRRGRRIYAEGGGLAYLCQAMQLADGQRYRMAGIFPAVARRNTQPGPAVPVEISLDRANWLGHAGSSLRGYLNPTWDLEPAGPLAGFVADPEHEFDLVGTFQAVGSRVHLNFAAQPEFLHHFFYPQIPCMRFPDPWTPAQ